MLILVKHLTNFDTPNEKLDNPTDTNIDSDSEHYIVYEAYCPESYSVFILVFSFENTFKKYLIDLFPNRIIATL